MTFAEGRWPRWPALDAADPDGLRPSEASLRDLEANAFVTLVREAGRDDGAAKAG